MQKLNSLLGAIVAAAFISGTAGDAEAQQRMADVNGCAVLADVVYSEIFVSVLFGNQRLPLEPGLGGALSCADTAASVSSGFARAMAATNVLVTWSVPDPQNGAVCAGGDIALCYPLSKPVTSRGALDAGSVAGKWQVVSAIVSRTMPAGTFSDTSSFREYELRTQLSGALSRRAPVSQGGDVRR